MKNKLGMHGAGITRKLVNHTCWRVKRPGCFVQYFWKPLVVHMYKEYVLSMWWYEKK